LRYYRAVHKLLAAFTLQKLGIIFKKNLAKV
jgi:hypothetical protein